MNSSTTQTRTRQKLALGTRKSALALTQTESVAEQLRWLHPELEIDVVKMSSKGDEKLLADTPLPEIGGKGLFTAELDSAIAKSEIDAAVHSLKDLPTDPEKSILIKVIGRRADVRDVLVSAGGTKFDDLKPGSVIGTSSPRRTAQILAKRSDLTVEPIRGNVARRLSKLDGGQFDAIVIAAAGLERLNLSHRVTQYFSCEEMMPAPGQGALAVTLRADDDKANELFDTITERETSLCVSAERELLARLGGGCSSPIAAYATVVGDKILLAGRVCAPDGSKTFDASAQADDPAAVAKIVADKLFDQGCDSVFSSTGGDPSPPPQTSLDQKPLIVVTRPAERATKTLATLTANGFEPKSLPLIKFRPLPISKIEARSKVDETDWLLFTSATGVAELANLLGTEPPADTIKIGCVGPETAATIYTKFGRSANFVPSMSSGATMGAEVPVEPGESVLIPGPAVSEPSLIGVLGRRGLDAEAWPIYVTEQTTLTETEIAEIVKADAIFFASPSAVKSFCKQVPDPALTLQDMLVVCIGPTTKNACETFEIDVGVALGATTSQALVAALAAELKNVI